MGNEGNILESFVLTVLIIVLLSFILVPILYVPTIPLANPDAEITSMTRLVDSIRMNDASVRYGKVTKQEYFFVPAQELIVDTEPIYVFEFASAIIARQAVDRISKDGSTIGDKQISWIGQPHFFQSGPLVVLYVGEKRETLSILMYLFGHQVAGIVTFSQTACSSTNPCEDGNTCYVFAGESLCLDVDPCTLCIEKACTIAEYEPAQIICE